MKLSSQLLLIFFLVAILAGGVDAIAGGGGLITIPCMLAAGIPPTAAIATNKLGGVAGTFACAMHFVRKGEIDFKKSGLMMVTALGSAWMGGLVITRIDNSLLAVVVPILLITFSAYFLMAPTVGEVDKKARVSPTVFALLPVPLIGFYDGFFGPGTGTFLALAFTLMLGFNILKATAYAKLLNLCSNLAALAFFVCGNQIIWKLGIAMLFGQFIGGYTGAHLAMKNGKKLIRTMMVIVAVATSIKLLFFR